jgi:hypothetical protein
MYKKYDQKFLQTPEGKALWIKWRNARPAGLCREWKDFEVFKKWALAHNYSSETLLKRYNPDLPHSPENSYFRPSQKRGTNSVTQDQVEKWNETVNRIRVHYGMKPLGVE